MAIGEALGGIIGGVLGNNAAKMDRSNQKKMMKQMVEEYKKIGYPPDYAREIIMQDLIRQGVYTPTLEQDLSDSVAESEFENLYISPESKESQMEALGMIKNLAKVGLGAEDRAALNQVRSQVQTDAEAKRQQILQQLQAQGMGGSGASLMAQLGAVQQAADLASQQSDSTMAQASSARRQAIEQLGRSAGEIRQADYNQAADKARAIDERDRFLAENTIARQQRNTQSVNQAQQLNLTEQQRIADANTQMKNNELLRQRDAEQRQYSDKLNYAAGITGQQGKLAGFYGDTANQKAQAQMGMAKGAGGLADAGVMAAFGVPASGTGATATPGTSGYGEMFKKFGAAAEGGIVGDLETTGATAGPDNVNMDLREGEMVLNADQQKGLFDFINRISKKYPKV